jgi:hypothetical protein
MLASKHLPPCLHKRIIPLDACGWRERHECETRGGVSFCWPKANELDREMGRE